jgi:hypothetical protein
MKGHGAADSTGGAEAGQTGGGSQADAYAARPAPGVSRVSSGVLLNNLQQEYGGGEAIEWEGGCA